jgi:chromosome segregation ATPase
MKPASISLVFRGTAGAAAALALGAALAVQAATPALARAEETVRGESKIISLEAYTPDSTLAESVSALRDAEKAVQDSARQAADQIRQALEQLERDKTVVAEFRLYAANAKAIADQDAALSGYQRSLDNTASALDGIAEELAAAQEDFLSQGKDAATRRTTSNRRCEDIRGQLAAMARRLPDLLNEEGRLDPAVEGAVLVLDSILRGEELSAEAAEVEAGVVQQDAKQLNEAMAALKRHTATLRAASESIHAKRALLANAARRQHDSMLRRAKLWRAAEASKAVSQVDLEALIRLKPVIQSPRIGPSAAEVTIAFPHGTSALDVLRRFSEHPDEEKKALAGSENRSDAAVDNITQLEGGQHEPPQ